MAAFKTLKMSVFASLDRCLINKLMQYVFAGLTELIFMNVC